MKSFYWYPTGEAKNKYRDLTESISLNKDTECISAILDKMSPQEFKSPVPSRKNLIQELNQLFVITLEAMDDSKGNEKRTTEIIKKIISVNPAFILAKIEKEDYSVMDFLKYSYYTNMEAENYGKAAPSMYKVMANILNENILTPKNMASEWGMIESYLIVRALKSGYNSAMKHALEIIINNAGKATVDEVLKEIQSADASSYKIIEDILAEVAVRNTLLCLYILDIEEHVLDKEGQVTLIGAYYEDSSPEEEMD